MKKNSFRKFSSLILIAAMIMTMIAGCGKKDAPVSKDETPVSVSETVSEKEPEASVVSTEEEPVVSEEENVPSEEEVVSDENTAKYAFTFIAVDKEGNETKFDIKTDKETVGEALVDEGLVEGDESAYGLYVTKVNGIEAKWEVDQTYWAFYINGEYATTGVDSTNVEDGATYMFKIEG